MQAKKAEQTIFSLNFNCSFAPGVFILRRCDHRFHTTLLYMFITQVNYQKYLTFSTTHHFSGVTSMKVEVGNNFMSREEKKYWKIVTLCINWRREFLWSRLFCWPDRPCIAEGWSFQSRGRDSATRLDSYNGDQICERSHRSKTSKCNTANPGAHRPKQSQW